MPVLIAPAPKHQNSFNIQAKARKKPQQNRRRNRGWRPTEDQPSTPILPKPSKPVEAEPQRPSPEETKEKIIQTQKPLKIKRRP